MKNIINSLAVFPGDIEPSFSIKQAQSISSFLNENNSKTPNDLLGIFQSQSKLLFLVL